MDAISKGMNKWEERKTEERIEYSSVQEGGYVVLCRVNGGGQNCG